MRVAVFCGSREGRSPAYKNAARHTGALLASQGIGIVYGGGTLGLMGELADAAIEAGGEVIGIMPHALAKREQPVPNAADLRIVGSMHERKAMMADLADAFIAMPGGIGTLEEIFEVWTWAQLGQHRKPCCFLSVNGYYDNLFLFVDHMIKEGFLLAADRDILIVRDSPEDIMAAIGMYHPPITPPWLTLQDI